MTKPLTILYFAWLRETIGVQREDVVLPDGVNTVAALILHLSQRGDAYQSAFATTRKVRCAVNQEFADPATLIHPGDEVGFFPPVTGG